MQLEKRKRNKIVQLEKIKKNKIKKFSNKN